VIYMPEVIEVIYEKGVLKPLKKVDLKEGEKLKIIIEKTDFSKYYGAFGKASADELKMLEEEAQF